MSDALARLVDALGNHLSCLSAGSSDAARKIDELAEPAKRVCIQVGHDLFVRHCFIHFRVALDGDQTSPAIRQKLEYCFNSLAHWERLNAHVTRIRALKESPPARDHQIARFVEFAIAVLGALNDAVDWFPPETGRTGWVERKERALLCQEVCPRYEAWLGLYDRAIAEAYEWGVAEFALPKLEQLHVTLGEVAKAARKAPQSNGFLGTPVAQRLANAITAARPLIPRQRQDRQQRGKSIPSNLAGPADTGPYVPAAEYAKEACLFTRQGKTWLTVYADVPKSVDDSVGMAYICRLLQNPGQDTHAAALRSAIAGEGDAPLLGSAGDMLDERALKEFREHLTDLEEEIRETEANHDIGRAQRLKEDLVVVHSDSAAKVATEASSV